jgi:FkbH-like protein
MSEAPPALLRILVCGTVTTEPLESPLVAALAARGHTATCRHAPFNQVYPTLFDGSAQDDVVVVLWRMEELLAPALGAVLRDPAGAREWMEGELGRLAEAARAFVSRSAATLILAMPPRPHVRPLGLIDPAHDGGIAALHAECLVAWRRLAASVPGLILLDLDGLQRDQGDRFVQDTRLLYLARVPWSHAFLQTVGARIARLIAASRTPARKVIALDCDNTLWGGVVGEDGPLGVDIGDDGVGAAFRAFQKYLLALREQGFLLVITSKNNEADVWEVFEKNPGMALRRDDITAARIGWGAKSASLREMADELNLGLDSFVFIDDNPVECEEVRARAPGVAALQLPEDPADFVTFLGESEAFDRLSLTDEDLVRARLYSEEKRREAVRASAGSMDEYLRGLGVRVTVEPVGESTLPRIAQLVNKTNQFNLTTIRRSEPEVRALSRDERFRLFSVRVEDRFGAYGLTGAAFVECVGSEWSIETFLLSCRVLSRGVEFAVMARLAARARAEGASRLTARFVPSPKNAVAAPFLSAAGFSLQGEVHVADLSVVPLSAPEHVTLLPAE